jgi:hypothetical protein
MRCSSQDCNEEIAPNELHCSKCGMDAPPQPQQQTPSPADALNDEATPKPPPPSDNEASPSDKQTSEPKTDEPGTPSTPAPNAGQAAAANDASDSGKANDATPRKDPNDNPKQPKARQHFNFSRSRIRDFNNITANIGINWKGEPAEISLTEYLSNLPTPALTDPGTTAFLREDLQIWTQSLRANRMLLVNCNDPALSRAAAVALSEAIGVPEGHRKLLNFDRLPAGMEPGIHHLTNRRIDPKAETIVVADAARVDRAKSFVNSIFSVGGNYTVLDRIKALREAGLWVICQTDPDRIASILAKSKELPIGCWHLSYLRLRFPEKYRDYEAVIARQRAAGGWSQDAGEFHRQISTLSDEDLVEAIRKGGVSAEADGTDELLKIENPLHLAVLYTGTFYPDLSPSEFSQLLAKFIGEQEMLVAEPVKQKAKDGIFKTVDLKHSKKLSEIWRERSDAVLRECELITSTEGKHSITFANVGRRDRLRREFEQFSGVYVHEQFVAAYAHKLLFDPSDQIGQDVVALTIDMMRGNPDEFDVEWLRGIVLAAKEETPAGASSRLVIQRIADLLQAMLENAALAPAVPELLRRLLGNAAHALTFEIVKKLRYSPGFEAFEWLRQIVDQAPEELRNEVYEYFSTELKQPGRLYPLLYALESWLPGAQRAPETYAPSNAMALRLGMGYFVEITRRFDRASYGVWPSSFPLFAVDSDNAGARLGLIVKWLLHPGVPAVFADVITPDELARLVAALSAEWVFFLVGSPAPAHPESAANATLPTVAATTIYDLLVEKIADATKEKSQKDVQKLILEYWEELKHYLTIPPEESGEQGLRLRRERAWKRELMRRLITEFRERQRTHRASVPLSHRATA